MLVNCQLMGGAHEGQAGFTENAEFRVHLNRALCGLRSRRDFAALFRFTPDYFSRRFRAHFGAAPRIWLKWSACAAQPMRCQKHVR